MPITLAVASVAKKPACQHILKGMGIVLVALEWSEKEHARLNTGHYEHRSLLLQPFGLLLCSWQVGIIVQLVKDGPLARLALVRLAIKDVVDFGSNCLLGKCVRSTYERLRASLELTIVRSRMFFAPGGMNHFDRETGMALMIRKNEWKCFVALTPWSSWLRF